MWKKLIPREEKFFEMFHSMAENAQATADLLVEMMERFDQLSDRASSVKAKEHLGDTYVHELIHKLNSTFVTPLDREDIHHLASAIDDIVDLAHAASNRIVLYDIGTPVSGALELTRILRLQTREIVQAVHSLPTSDRILERCIEIHRLENEGDRVFQESMARLFKEETNPIRLIKHKEVLESIERATDSCEDVANVLEAIFMKNA